MENKTDKIWFGLVCNILLMLFFAYMFSNALMRSMENQDKMLCNSAKVSGNLQYLQKCECYYNGEGIKCLQN